MSSQSSVPAKPAVLSKKPSAASPLSAQPQPSAQVRGNIARAIEGVAGQSKLEVVGAGSGGVPEMVQYMSNNEVMWALLRFDYGAGAFARTKVVFLHFNGEDAPVIRRGQANALTKTVTHFLRNQGRDHFHASLQLKDVSEVTVEYIMNTVSEHFVVDSIASKGTASMLKDYHEQLAKEQADAQERVEAARQREREVRARRVDQQAEMAANILVEAGGEQSLEVSVRRSRPSRKSLLAVPPSAQAPNMVKRASVLTQLSIEGLTQVGTGGKWNWILIGPDVAKLPLLGGGCGGVGEMRAAAEANQDLVMFGLVRVQFSAPGFSQTRFCLLHIIGEGVSAVKRGKWNAQRPSFEKRFCEFASVSGVCADVAVSDVATQTVLEKVGHTTSYLAEGAAGNTVSALRAYQQSLINERLNAVASQKPQPSQVLRERLHREDRTGLQQLQKEPESDLEEAEEEEEEQETVPHAGASIDEVRRFVRESRECNWALIRPRPARAGPARAALAGGA